MINTVTLNPAIDKVFFLDKVVMGTANRVKRMEITMGGKGTHVSMNLRLMNTPSRAFGLAYGGTGQAILDMLAQWEIDAHFAYREDAESRTNYLLVEENGPSTLICEKGVDATPQDTENLIALLQRQVRPGDFLVLAGDASNYADPNIYNRLMTELASKTPRVFVDASGETLKKSLAMPLFMIKPNEDELESLLGTPIKGDGDVLRAIDRLDSRHQIEVIAVSLGKRGAIVKMQDGLYKTYPPDVAVCNTVGCGDCFVAGLLYGFEQGLSAIDTLNWATAASSAAAEEVLSVGFSMDRAKALLSDCRTEKLY